jgi:hypothetical protein
MDWEAFNWPPQRSNPGAGTWDAQPLILKVVHRPSKAAFKLEYGANHLLSMLHFLRKQSEAPAADWNQDGPELQTLARQAHSLFLRRWQHDF